MHLFKLTGSLKSYIWKQVRAKKIKIVCGNCLGFKVVDWLRCLQHQLLLFSTDCMEVGGSEEQKKSQSSGNRLCASFSLSRYEK